MNRIATLNLAEIETVVGGVGTGLLADATLSALKVPTGGNGKTPQRPNKQNSGGTMEHPSY